MRDAFQLLVMMCTTGVGAMAAQSLPSLPLEVVWRVDPEVADLYQAAGFTVLRDGTVAVSRFRAPGFRLLTPQGKVEQIGTMGEGPGDYRQVMRLGTIGDSLWAFDVLLRRTTILDPARRPLRIVPLPRTIAPPPPSTERPTNAYGITPAGFFGNGDFLATAGVLLEGRPASWHPAAHAGETAILRLGAGGELRRIIGWIPPTPCSFRWDRNPDRVEWPIAQVLTIPRCAGMLWGASPDMSRIALLRQGGADRPGSYDITMLDGAGREIYRRSVTSSPVAVPAREIDSLFTAELDRMKRPEDFLAAARRMVVLPRYHPAAQSLLVGSDGTLWVRQPDVEGKPSWRVLDAAGKDLGLVRLPARSTLRVAERRNLWVLEAGEDDIAGVVRYRVGG